MSDDSIPIPNRLAVPTPTVPTLPPRPGRFASSREREAYTRAVFRSVAPPAPLPDFGGDEGRGI